MDLQVGDEVLIWSESRGDKLKERGCGPAQITWIGEKGAVQVKRLDNGRENVGWAEGEEILAAYGDIQWPNGGYRIATTDMEAKNR